jgi:uncharacterized RDD family membrane protein YckC
MADKLTLETPEQLEINYNIARLGSRFIAALWDTFFIVCLEILLVFGTYLVIDQIEGVIGDAVNWIVGIMVFMVFAIFWGYYVIFELLWNGQSPGKRLTGIRTVRYNGAPIGLSESAIRNIVRIIDFFPGAYGFGVISMFADLKSRRLGDFAAGTLVVHDKVPVSLDTLGKQVTTDTRLLEPALPNLHRLEESEVEAVRRFLQRRDTLQNDIQLAAHLATRLRSKLELESPHSSLGQAREDLDLLKRVVAQWSN